LSLAQDDEPVQILTSIVRTMSAAPSFQTQTSKLRLRASVLAIVFHFLGSALADFPFGLKRNQLAGILGNLVPVSTVIGTLVTAAGRNSRTRNPQTCTKYE
jgi:hypothetical protein